MKRRNKSSDHGWLFISGATHRRLPLFRNSQFCEIFLGNLHFYRHKYGFDVVGYVVLPDHYHLLLAMPEEVRLADFLRDFKSQVGRRIVEGVKKKGRNRLLKRMAVGRVKRWKDARFRALQADNHVRRIFSERFLRQKLDYIHMNPVREGLARNPAEYPFSSARWYAGGEEERTQWQGPLG